MFDISIIYEDNDLAVINKPAGVVVNRADTIKEPTLQDWWAEREKLEVGNMELEREKWQELVPSDFASEYGTPEEVWQERGGIVHRLDKETSGVMILAKNPGALVHLLRQFRLRETQKKYICLVHGKFQVLEDTITAPLGRSTLNRTKFTVMADGRVAETKYQVVKQFSGVDAEKITAGRKFSAPHVKKKLQQTYQGFALVECWPKTGRTHQLRVHFSHLHHPIVSDETYLGHKRVILDATWCPRLFLHAAELSFSHPRSGKKLTFQAELPQELQQALEVLIDA
jgi:23S rRNA pseudouridine1911/1915/1917 synthase